MRRNIPLMERARREAMQADILSPIQAERGLCPMKMKRDLLLVKMQTGSSSRQSKPGSSSRPDDTGPSYCKNATRPGTPSRIDGRDSILVHGAGPTESFVIVPVQSTSFGTIPVRGDPEAISGESGIASLHRFIPVYLGSLVWW
jgi:hypothetical protein